MATNGKKTKETAEFGDFQTPNNLAITATAVLNNLDFRPASIIEPTCGVGSFLDAALARFPEARSAVGVDINPKYVDAARDRLHKRFTDRDLTLTCASFFATDWNELFARLPDPLLVIGNPPWVTNSDLGSLGSENLPVKSNFQKHSGFDALTGKSNFDISEWMLIHLLEKLNRRDAVLAMLCKTAVARKALFHAWKKDIPLQSSSIYLIDAAKHFGAAVDACFLVCRISGMKSSHECQVFTDFHKSRSSRVFGYRDGQIVADVVAYDKWKHLQGMERYQWRSGIKHDCSSVMELRREGDVFRNGLGELVELEQRYLYPMLKSSQVANGKVQDTTRWMIVPQSTTGEETDSIAVHAPATWSYLQRHAHLLDRRGSSIYKKRPRFSIFGIGPYSFAPWKVAISGFYKSLRFRLVGPIDNVPTVLDDTSNFLSFNSEDEARHVADLLNSEISAEFLQAFIFWDAKRPLTIDLLRRLDLLLLARATGNSDQLASFLEQHSRSTVSRNVKTKSSDGPTLFPELVAD